MKPSSKWIARTRWALLLTASLATLLALFVAVENWRGDRAWAAYGKGLKARGESLDLATFHPPPVPDALNFFKAPLLARLMHSRKDDPDQKNLLAELRLEQFDVGTMPVDFTVLRANFKQAGLLQLPESDRPAADVLQAMQRLEPLFEDLREAALKRPAAVLPQGESPFDFDVFDAGRVFKIAQALFVHAHAELAMGRFDAAFVDTFALLRLSNSLLADPTNLMVLLVGHGIHGLAANVIKAGCDRHVWSDVQLAEFQRLLTLTPPLKPLGLVLRHERAMGIYFMDALPELPELRLEIPRWLFHGWAQQNKIALCRHYEDELLPVFAADPERVFPDRLEHLQQAIRQLKQSRSPYLLLSRLVVNNLSGIGEGYCTGSALIQAVATLCALERHRLAKGQWPEKLEELVPRFVASVPVDIFTGQPLRYRFSPGAPPQLYSAGPNGRDDEGTKDDILLYPPNRN